MDKKTQNLKTTSLAQENLNKILEHNNSEARDALRSALAKSKSLTEANDKVNKKVDTSFAKTGGDLAKRSSKESSRGSSKAIKSAMKSSNVRSNVGTTEIQSKRRVTEKAVPTASKRMQNIKGQRDLNEIYSNLLSDDLNHYVAKENEEHSKEETHRKRINISINWKGIVETAKQIFYNSKKFLKVVLGVLAGLITVTCTGVLCYAFVLSFSTMPALAKCYNKAHAVIENSTKSTFKKEDNSFVYDKDGNTLAKLRQNRDTDYVKYNEIPEKVINAFIATEDKRFYDHHGVDLQSTAKAVEILVKGKLGESTEVERGGSTITQQMVKNVFLTNKKSYDRKIKEIFLALEVEKKYSKEEILEFYINNCYFYNNCYGFRSTVLLLQRFRPVDFSRGGYIVCNPKFTILLQPS